jgi:hypothetical protein
MCPLKVARIPESDKTRDEFGTITPLNISMMHDAFKELRLKGSGNVQLKVSSYVLRFSPFGSILDNYPQTALTTPTSTSRG